MTAQFGVLGLELGHACGELSKPGAQVVDLGDAFGELRAQLLALRGNADCRSVAVQRARRSAGVSRRAHGFSTC